MDRPLAYGGEMTINSPSCPIVGVGAAVWKDGKVLLIQRGHPPRQGSWSLPGGRQELGETVYQAVEREIAEETGLAIDILDIVAVVDLISRDADSGNISHHYTVIDVAARWKSGQAVAGDDALAVVWASPDDLDRFALTAEVLRVITLSQAKLSAAKQA